MGITARFFVIFLTCCIVTSCSYVQHTFRQAGYKQQFKRDHERSIQKHLLSSETFFVYGKLVDKENLNHDFPLAVAAMVGVDDETELVDITHFAQGNTFYGLHLPEGDYQILTLADLNADGVYNNSEIIAILPLYLDQEAYPYCVAGSLDILIDRAIPSVFHPKIDIPVQSPAVVEERQSIVYPKGTIRRLDDPLFLENNAKLGLYSPADFMEQAPMMFYTLEESCGYKVPVVFVHGIGGSVTDFSPIIESLDRQRYQPWFFYYPSGADLEKLAKLFYQIFLSGEVIPLSDRMPLIVVAHSMGGVVVRRSINFYKDVPEENKISLFISIATPFGGHPEAKIGIERAPMVLPSWYNMNPEGKFILDLYTKPVPNFIEHHLFYAYGNQSTVKFGENSDGVVPISSQLHAPAQKQSTRQYGYNQGHVDILKDQEMITNMLTLISEHKAPIPESHMKYFIKGGFDVQLSDAYTDYERYAIHYIGKYLSALAKGFIQPVEDYETHFVSAINGEIKPSTFSETAWFKFKADFPELAESTP